MSEQKAKLTLPGMDKTLELDVLTGTEGPDVIDIAPLYGQAGVFTYDPGFVSTASCHSKITYIGNTAVSRLSDRAVGGEKHLLGGLLPAAQRRTAVNR